jgi:hypothetical protein
VHRSAASTALAVPLLLAAAMAPATAAPVSSGRLAAVAFTVPVSDEVTLQVQLRAVDTDADYATVAVSRCEDGDCAPVRYYEGTLPSGALQVDPGSATATLDTTLGGLPIRVTWTPQDGAPAAAIGGIDGGGRGEDNGFTTYLGVPAATAVTLPSGVCKGRGAVGDAVRVVTSDAGNGSASPLSRLRLRAAGTPTCAE